jgi:hypothetical protein
LPLERTFTRMLCASTWLVALAVVCVAADINDTDADPSFGFSPVLGDWMVLQQAPAAAAVYGPVSASATHVTVTVSDGHTSYTVVAKVGKDATHQPYGYVDPKTGAQLPVVADTWKAVRGLLMHAPVCKAYAAFMHTSFAHLA